MAINDEIAILAVLRSEGNPCRACGEAFTVDDPNVAHFHAVCPRCLKRTVHVLYFGGLPTTNDGSVFEAALTQAAHVSCPEDGLVRIGDSRRLLPLGSDLAVSPHLAVEALDLVQAASVPAVDPLWGPWHARGESLLIVAPTGRGKTTLAMRYARSALGADAPKLLRENVAPQDRILYLAVDRAPQQRRFLARLWPREEQHAYRDRLRMWAGPLPLDVEREPWKLAEFCHEVGKAPTLVIVDVIEGVAPGVHSAEGAGRYAQARDTLVSNGIDVLELHHLKKAQGDEVGKKPTTTDRVYGGRQLTDRAGGILQLWAAKADSPILDLETFKSPVGHYPVLKLDFDRERHHIEVATDVTLTPRKSDRKRQILLTVREQGTPMVIGDLEPLFGVSKRTLQRDLEELVVDNALRYTGDGNDRAYVASGIDNEESE